MSEENKTEETVKLNSDDIKAMEDDARRASQSEAKAIADDVEKKVRKEIEQENALKKLQEEKVAQDKALQEIKKSQDAQIEALKGDFENKLRNIEDSRKSTVKTDNPFRSKDESEKKEILQQLRDPVEMRKLEEESRREFLNRHKNISDSFGQY